MRAYQMKWQEYLQINRRMSERTQWEYSKDLEDFDRWMNTAETKVDDKDIDTRIVELYIAMMSQRNLATSTIKRRVSALRSYFAYLQRIGIRNDNPALSVETPRLTLKLVKPCRLETLTAYLKKPAITEADKMLHAVTALIVSSGLRISECLNIDLKDVNAREKSIKIAGKGARERIVYYNETARQHLNRYAAGKTGRIFADWSDRDVRDLMQAEMRENGHGIHPHQLRHAYATELLNNGADLMTIKTLLGHQQIGTTARYMHVATARTRQEYEKYSPRI